MVSVKNQHECCFQPLALLALKKLIGMIIIIYTVQLDMNVYYSKMHATTSYEIDMVVERGKFCTVTNGYIKPK